MKDNRRKRFYEGKVRKIYNDILKRPSNPKLKHLSDEGLRALIVAHEEILIKMLRGEVEYNEGEYESMLQKLTETCKEAHPIDSSKKNGV